MQSALAFPLQWLMLPLGVSKAWGWIALLRLLIAGLGAYALARRLGAAWGGAMLAGLAYMLCAPNITWAQWPLGTEFALFPWLLLATDRVLERPGPGGSPGWEPPSGCRSSGATRRRSCGRPCSRGCTCWSGWPAGAARSGAPPARSAAAPRSGPSPAALRASP